MYQDYYIVSQTTGDANTSSQILTQNTRGYYNSISLGRLDQYLYPVYSLEGASLNYYEVDYNSISYDITNGKSYTIFFSGESSVSVINHTGNTVIKHELYRLPFTANTLFQNSPQITLSGTNFSGEQEDILISANTIIKSENTLTIDDYFTIPLVSYSEQVSAITISNSAYTFNFPTQYKDEGNFTQNTFSDKDQFFLDTSFSFELENDMTIGDAYYLSGGAENGITRLYVEPSATTIYNSNLGLQTITGETVYSGSSFNGAFFTYFVPPKKPNLNVSLGNQSIAVQGQQTNLSPAFNFANVDDGDYYKLQVNYDNTDTPFSGSEIYTYIINKQVGDSEYVRTYSTPLRANDDFIYRIGNTKEVVNVFGNKQSITTWSDTISASIVATGTFRLSGYTWRNYVTNSYNGSYQISGMTIGAASSSSVQYNFSTSEDLSMTLNTISATTSFAFSNYIIDVKYNGTLSTNDWRNALYSATSWSSLGLYVVNDSINTGLTDSTFNFTTVSQGMPNVNLTLYQIYNSTQLDVAIDLRRSRRTVVQDNTLYPDTTFSGIQFNRTSSSTGFFDFGNLNGGYYRLVATPEAPQYAAYITIDTYITLNSDTSLNLIFYILWGNQDFTFEDLSNETFL